MKLLVNNWRGNLHTGQLFKILKSSVDFQNLWEPTHGDKILVLQLQHSTNRFYSLTLDVRREISQNFETKCEFREINMTNQKEAMVIVCRQSLTENKTIQRLLQHPPDFLLHPGSCFVFCIWDPLHVSITFDNSTRWIFQILGGSGPNVIPKVPDSSEHIAGMSTTKSLEPSG